MNHPVINDVQALLWQNLSISCWPTVLLCDPFGKPLKFFVGEGHRQEMIDFVQIAMEFFKEEIQHNKLEAKLPPLEFGLQPIESVLKYPGKVLVQNDLIFISDSGNHRIIIGDLLGNIKVCYLEIFLFNIFFFCFWNDVTNFFEIFDPSLSLVTNFTK